jgi:hypothetical protein
LGFEISKTQSYPSRTKLVLFGEQRQAPHFECFCGGHQGNTLKGVFFCVGRQSRGQGAECGLHVEA